MHNETVEILEIPHVLDILDYLTGAGRVEFDHMLAASFSPSMKQEVLNSCIGLRRHGLITLSNGRVELTCAGDDFIMFTLPMFQ